MDPTTALWVTLAYKENMRDTERLYNVVPARGDKGFILRDDDGRRITPQRIPEEINKKIQEAYWATFEERNPNMYVVRVDYHADEYFKDKVSGQ